MNGRNGILAYSTCHSKLIFVNMHLSTVMQQLVTFWSNYLTCLASIINDTPLSLFLCLFLFIKYIFIFPLAFLQIC